jgi:hypothetical protein
MLASFLLLLAWLTLLFPFGLFSFFFGFLFALLLKIFAAAAHLVDNES